MELCVIVEQRFARTPDLAIWTDSAFPYSIWRRYLRVFDRVNVVARIVDIPIAPHDYKRADGNQVMFTGVPNYVGPMQYVSQSRRIRDAVVSGIGDEWAIIMRVPSPIASTVWSSLRREGRPYAVEVAGDPHDVFAPGAVRHPLRVFFRYWFTLQLKRQCANATAASYVTEHTLQKRYTCPAFSIGVSDVELTSDSFVSSARVYEATSRPLIMITVGSLAQLYKGPDVLIDALTQCVDNGLDLKLIFVGDGKHRSELEDRVRTNGMEDRVTFLGVLPSGARVREQLDAADLFVLPSRTEGLPRALLEAMARALPCIGSTVGGIPELLPLTDLVAPSDVHSLASKIREVVDNPKRMTLMSAQNLERARKYREELLQERRISFHQQVRKTTEAWIKKRSKAGRTSSSS